MVEVFPTLLLGVVIVGGLLFFLTIVFALAKQARSMRVALVAETRRPRNGQRLLGQQLELRQMLDAAMAADAPTLEGESLTVNGVTYDNVDLIALAKAITDSGAQFFGASWCPHCEEQEAMFGDGVKYLPYIEASTPSHGQSQAGIDNNITTFPTWIFADGTRVTGTQSLEDLIQYTGIEVPTGEPLYLADIADQVDLKAGQAYHVALDGYSPYGYDLTYTVSTSSGQIYTEVLQGNHSLRIETTRFGTMEFYLFEQEASLATSRIIELANSGFYDGTIFHRIIDNFVIQGGDAGSNPDGVGGSDLPEFDDIFNVNLRHNETGMISFAKPGYDDSNNSQFFITEGDQSHLDFQHSVFGFMTEGESVREAISGTPSTSANNYRPTYDVVLKKVSIFTDTENAVLRLKLPDGLPPGETVTVTVDDGHGHTVSKTFSVSAVTDTTNYNPFLSFIPDVTLTQGDSYSFQMTSTSVDGDPVKYYTASTPPTGLTFTVDPATGLLQVQTDNTLAAGTYTIYVAVSDDVASPTSDMLDYQGIDITVATKPVLTDDTVNATEDQPITFNPLTNDSSGSSDFQPSSVFLKTLPAVGDLSVNHSTGEITFTPPANYFGTVSFEYQVANRDGIYGDYATVSLVVAPVNDQPTAYGDFFYADVNRANLLSVLRNDDRGNKYEANDPLTISLPSATTAQGGIVTVSGDQVLYVPAADFTGSDSFTYVIHDGDLTSTATVDVDVRSVGNFTVSAVASPTDTIANDFIDGRPQSDSVIGEWTPFWLEVWVTPDGTGGDSVTAASATLNFDPTVYRASSISYGSGFIPQTGSILDNNSGFATLKATSSISGLGSGGRVLLARVKFVPVANGLDAPSVGQSLGDDFSTFFTSLSNAAMTVDGVGSIASPTVDDSISTKLMPMVFDLNDDGRVGLTDYSLYLQSSGGSINRFVDFDYSGSVSDADFEWFRQAFGSTFDGSNSQDAFAITLLDAAASNLIIAAQLPEMPIPAMLTGQDVESVTVELPPNIVSNVAGPNIQDVSIQIVDLPGNQLAKTVGNTIYLDTNAAGWGWFIDTTPTDSSEFQQDAVSKTLVAPASSPASSQIDLVSVLMHELGHVAGLTHTDEGLMSSTLLPGQRIIDWQSDSLDETFYIDAVDQFFADENDLGL